MALLDSYREVLGNIREAAVSAGRDPDSVKLIAVSKFKPLSMIRELYDAGQKAFGENHVQELVEKQDAFPDPEYHMIGHLQRNKVRSVTGRVKLIHSVDSLRLAEEISKEAVKKGIVQDILIEINAGNEESKYGFLLPEAEQAVRDIALLKGTRVRGFMCVAPFTADPEENRPLFRKMFQLAVDIQSKNIDNIDVCELSMGMTNDYQTAISEGATLVRIGTAIFGAREYQK